MAVSQEIAQRLIGLAIPILRTRGRYCDWIGYPEQNHENGHNLCEDFSTLSPIGARR